MSCDFITTAGGFDIDLILSHDTTELICLFYVMFHEPSPPSYMDGPYSSGSHYIHFLDFEHLLASFALYLFIYKPILEYSLFVC